MKHIMSIADNSEKELLSPNSLTVVTFERTPMVGDYVSLLMKDGKPKFFKVDKIVHHVLAEKSQPSLILKNADKDFDLD